MGRGHSDVPTAAANISNPRSHPTFCTPGCAGEKVSPRPARKAKEAEPNGNDGQDTAEPNGNDGQDTAEASGNDGQDAAEASGNDGQDAADTAEAAADTAEAVADTATAAPPRKDSFPPKGASVSRRRRFEQKRVDKASKPLREEEDNGDDTGGAPAAAEASSSDEDDDTDADQDDEGAGTDARKAVAASTPAQPDASSSASSSSDSEAEAEAEGSAAAADAPGLVDGKRLSQLTQVNFNLPPPPFVDEKGKASADVARRSIIVPETGGEQRRALSSFLSAFASLSRLHIVL